MSTSDDAPAESREAPTRRFEPADAISAGDPDRFDSEWAISRALIAAGRLRDATARLQSLWLSETAEERLDYRTLAALDLVETLVILDETREAARICIATAGELIRRAGHEAAIQALLVLGSRSDRRSIRHALTLLRSVPISSRARRLPSVSTAAG